MINIAINGFGRIGRHVFKAGMKKENIKIVAINDLTDNKTLAHLLKHDSTYSDYEGTVEFDDKNLIVDGQKIPVFEIKDPSELPWKDLKVDIVMECTGRFREKEQAELHIKAGAKKVILSAPGKGGDIPMYVRAVNCAKCSVEEAIVIDNASCTTNCIGPAMAVLEEQFGIEKGFMTTAHGYTSDQNLQDGPHKDLRRSRAAAINMIPTTTGAAKAVGKVIPALVPIPTVSLADITVVLKKDVTVEEVNEAFKTAVKNARFEGVLNVTEEPLVSSDFVGNTYSSTVDLSLTNVVGGNLVKIVSWYDNEVGYSHRMVELAEIYGA